MTVDGSDNETLTGFDTSDDLDAFSKDFFKPVNHARERDEPAKEEPKAEETNKEPEAEVEETEELSETTDDHVDENPDDTESEDAEGEEEAGENDPEPAPKPKKNTAQDRINELTRQRHEDKRAADARIAALENQLRELAEKKPEPVVTNTSDAPTPTDKDKDGNDLYPLGEFDPNFIKDLVRFNVKQENDAAQAFRRKEEEQNSLAKARNDAQAVFVSKMEETRQEIPDIDDKIMSLEPILAGADQGYVQYLVDVVRTLDYGPKVMAYLADNPNVAKEIVSSGAASATVRLGKIDQMMVPQKKAEPKASTQAPPPPKKVPRGTTGSQPIRADTDDLDAFSNLMFNKKK